MDENLYGSLCLTDIPKELITTGKNGKKYLNIVVNKRREVSQFGMTHYVKAHCKKEQQREGVNYYIGREHVHWFSACLQDTRTCGIRRSPVR